jgi:putative transposase
MPRVARNTPGGLVYHVSNRSVGRMRLFRGNADFEAFQQVMVECYERHPIRILSYGVLSNHWHFADWPKTDDQVPAFFRWLAHTHAMRWRVAHRTVGDGPVYQGRLKSFPVQSDEHLLTVLRFVERNPLGAGLVARAEHWHWSSLWARTHGDDAIKGILSPWPVQRPVDWTRRVNAALSARELGRLRVSVARGQPFGENEWVKRMVRAHRLEHTVRPQGRPPKPKD